MTRVLVTGATSFTGCWLVQALAARGAEIIAPLNRGVGEGDQRRLDCLAKAEAYAKIVPDCPFGSSQFLDLLGSCGPFDLVVLHGAEVGDFRSPAFNLMGAVCRGTLNCGTVFDHLASMGCRRVVVTGSVFEADEGSGTAPLNAIGNYGLAKTLSWQIFRHEAHLRQFALGKLTIPHPFGALERPGLIHHLMKSWLSGEAASLNHPHYVRDLIHVDLLAEIYARFALALPMSAGLYRRSPRGYRETLGAFAERLATEMRPRLGLSCEIDKTQPVRLGSEPVRRHGTDQTTGLEQTWNSANSWNKLAQFHAPMHLHQLQSS